MFWCGSKNRYQEEVCSKEIGLCVPKYDNHSRPNSQHKWGSLYDHSMSTRIFNLIMNYIHVSSKNYEEKGYDNDLNLLTILY